MESSKKKLTKRQRLVAIIDVAKMVVKSSPLYLVIKVIEMIGASIMPLATTYFAASTTTALAEAYNGDETAGKRAIIYMFATAFSGLVMATWNISQSYFKQKSQYKINTQVEQRLYEKFLSLDFRYYDDKEIADLFEKSSKFSSSFTYIFDSMVGLISQNSYCDFKLDSPLFCWLVALPTGFSLHYSGYFYSN